jgi:DNA (cytosine-5)-methyltransferase 1
VIFFASRDGDQVPYLQPTHDREASHGLRPWVTVQDVLNEIDDQDPEAARFPESRLKYYRMLSAGENWKNLPLSIQKKAMGKSWFSGGGKTGFYRRLALDRPSPTLVTTPTMPATDLCHPTELRPLSIAEYRAIQTFPASFTLAGRTTDKYRQLGNAVPVAFSRAVAKHLLDFDAGRLKLGNAQTRFSRYLETDHLSWRKKTAV